MRKSQAPPNPCIPDPVANQLLFNYPPFRREKDRTVLFVQNPMRPKVVDLNALLLDFTLFFASWTTACKGGAEFTLVDSFSQRQSAKGRLNG